MIYLQNSTNNVKSTIAQVSDKHASAQVLAVYQSERWE